MLLGAYKWFLLDLDWKKNCNTVTVNISNTLDSTYKDYFLICIYYLICIFKLMSV